MIEEGYAFPGTITVASDSHSNMYGGVGCLGTPIVEPMRPLYGLQDVRGGRSPDCQGPIHGDSATGCNGQGCNYCLSGLFNKDEVLNYAIEFSGSENTMKSLSVDTRLTIANMTTEWGALTGLFPIDSTLEKWLRYKATVAAMAHELSDTLTAKRFSHQRLDDLFAKPIIADKGAKYAKYLYLNL